MPAAPLRRRHLHGVVHLDNRRGLCESESFILIVSFLCLTDRRRMALSPLLCLRFPFSPAPFSTSFLFLSMRWARERDALRAQSHRNSKKSAESGGWASDVWFCFFSIAKRRTGKKKPLLSSLLASHTAPSASPFSFKNPANAQKIRTVELDGKVVKLQIVSCF